jgi:hypothetical protein
MALSIGPPQSDPNTIVINVTMDTVSAQSFGMQFGLMYDPAILEVRDIAMGPFYGDSGSISRNWTISPDTQGNIPVGGVSLLGATNGITGSGVVAVITARGLGVGTTSVTLTCPADSVPNDAGTGLKTMRLATVGSASITVSPPATSTPTLTPTPTPPSGSPTVTQTATATSTPVRVATVTIDNKNVNVNDTFTLDLTLSGLQAGMVVRGTQFGVTTSPAGVMKVASVEKGSAFVTFASASHGLTSVSEIPHFTVTGGNVPNPGGFLLVTSTGANGGPTSGVLATLHMIALTAGSADVRLLLVPGSSTGNTGGVLLDQMFLNVRNAPPNGGTPAATPTSGGLPTSTPTPSGFETGTSALGATIIGGKVIVGSGVSTATPTATPRGGVPTATVTPTPNANATATTSPTPSVTPTTTATVFVTTTAPPTNTSIPITYLATPTPPGVGSMTVNFSPAALTPSPGQSGKVDVMINSSPLLRGFQFSLNFDPTVVQIDSIDPGPMFQTWADANNASVSLLPSFTVDNAAGTVTKGGINLLGGDPNVPFTGGPSGSGSVATISLHAVGNGSSALHLSDVGVSVPWYTDNSLVANKDKLATVLNIPAVDGKVLVGAAAQGTATAQATLTPQVTGTPVVGTPTATLNPTQQAAATAGTPLSLIPGVVTQNGATGNAAGTTPGGGDSTTGQPASSSSAQTTGAGQPTTAGQAPGASQAGAGSQPASTGNGARPGSQSATGGQPANATGGQPGSPGSTTAGVPGAGGNQPLAGGTPRPGASGAPGSQGPQSGQVPGTPGVAGVQAFAAPSVVTFDLGDAIDSRGVVTQDLRMSSPDESVRVLIPAGTVALTTDKRPVRTIQLTISSDLPVVPDDVFVAGTGFEFGPTGATFTPAITISLPYDPSAIPDTMAEDNVEPAFFDTHGANWVSLGGSVDPTAHTVTTQVTHFTTFAVLTKHGGVNWLLLVGIILVELGFGALGILLLVRWRRRGPGAPILPWRLPLHWPLRPRRRVFARPVSRDERLWGPAQTADSDPQSHSSA